MTHIDPNYRDHGLAVLETIYRGLYTALTRDAALKKSLVLFLPYYVQYSGGDYQVKLIHPEHRLGLTPIREDASEFFEKNKALIAEAVESGRSTASIAHQTVANINKAQKPGAWIDPEIDGRIQYRVHVERSRADNGAQQSSNEDAKVEYDVSSSCPHLYPALGVICQFDGKAIGMVSMDFDDQLCEKIEAAFNTFMEPYGQLSLWRELSGGNLANFFKTAQIAESWCDTKGNLHNNFKSASDVETAIQEIGMKLTKQEETKLRNVVSQAQGFSFKHRLLKCIQGSSQFSPAAWVALTSGKKNEVPAQLSEKHFSLHLTMREAGNHDKLRDVFIAAGELYGEWAWIDCALDDPWLLLHGGSNDAPVSVAQRLLMPRQPNEGGFIQTLWGLADAIHHAWPNDFKRLVEVRIVTDSVSDANGALKTLYKETPVGVILGGNNNMSVAVRGGWDES